MAHPYSDEIRQDRYASARKKLRELRGQRLTHEQMREIFGNYKNGELAKNAKEDHDAFIVILIEGWLIETRGGYMVAGRARSEAQTLNASEKEQLANIIQDCAEDIAALILSKANDVKYRFPLAEFVSYPDYPNTNTRICSNRPAIVLSTDNKDAYRSATALTPEGIFEYRYGRGHEDYARLESRSETAEPLLWIRYAEQALIELNGL